MQASCIFCKIIERQVPATIIAENEHAIAIKDIAPKAPIHYLLIPKKHITDLRSFAVEDFHIGAELYALAKQLSQGLERSDFRLIMNNGIGAGQSVLHAHMHFLAGKQFTDF